MIRLSWINESISNGEHDNLMHNAYYATELIAKSLKRANALKVLEQLHNLGQIADDAYIKFLVEIANNEGFTIASGS